MPAAPGRPQTTDPCENMSNATQNSRNSGDSRRRRSRGGQNRNNNNNSERRNNEGRQSDGRQSGGGRRDGGQSGRQDTGKPQRRPMPAPVQLSWWQKLLKAVGLYKEPVRPPRPERRPDAIEPAKTREPRRSQTRDARTEKRAESAEGQPAREPQGRGNRRERGDRGERDGGRRGGDPSSVENRRVYIGNLSYETTESDLEELFKGVGAVRRIEIVYNRNTHRSKGYGFVEMLDIEEAKRTVEVLHDQFFMGRKLTVSGAKSQEHEAAEKEESAGETKAQVMPVLAPLPPKAQVLDLVSEPKAEETIAEVIEEEPHAEIPTEEFHETPETVESQEETEQRPNA